MAQSNRKTWWLGLTIETDESLDLWDIIENVSKNAAKEQIGWGLIYASDDQAEESSPPDLNVNINTARYITPSGLQIEWASKQTVDISSANAGNLQGSTTVTPASTNNRYVVVAGAHKYVNADPALDEEGNTVYYSQNSSYEFKVWMTSEVSNLDVWYQSVVLKQLVDDIIAAGQVPIALAIRQDGVTVIAQSYLRQIAKNYTPFGISHEKGHELLNEYVSSGLLPMVLNASGTISANGVAVPGQEGKLRLVGGERIVFGIDGLHGYRWLYSTATESMTSMLIKDVPASLEIDFNGQGDNETFILRAYLDPNDLSLNFHAVKGDYPNDLSPGNDAHSVAWAINSGFPVTWIDIPLGLVYTNGSGIAPTFVPIACDWTLKNAAMASQIASLQDISNDNQPYVISASTPAFSYVPATLNLDVNGMTVWTKDGTKTVASTQLALSANGVHLIYIDTGSVPLVPVSADIALGGGPVANRDILILGSVITSGAQIDAVFWSPTNEGHVKTSGVIGADYHTDFGDYLSIAPCSCRADTESGLPYVFRNTHYAYLDRTDNDNWLGGGGMPAGAGWHYIYADPGGKVFSGWSATRNYVPFILDTNAPTALGVHPTDNRLKYVGSLYWDTVKWPVVRSINGRVLISGVPIVLIVGHVVPYDVDVSTEVPPTADTVLLGVELDTKTITGEVTVTFYSDRAAVATIHSELDMTGSNANGGGIEKHSMQTVEVPVHTIAGSKYFTYKLNNATARAKFYVLGYVENRERPSGNTYRPLITKN